MEEENNTLEFKEKMEQIAEHANWNKYLALTTAIIAVVAAIASLMSGSYANEAVLQKNDAILNQSKASDQWNYYQAKGIKKALADEFYQQTMDQQQKKSSEKYAKEQKQIQNQATEYEKKVKEANDKSDHLFDKHHKEALAVTFFQIAIALSAMSALLRRKSFWVFSILTSAIGGIFFTVGLL